MQRSKSILESPACERDEVLDLPPLPENPGGHRWGRAAERAVALDIVVDGEVDPQGGMDVHSLRHTMATRPARAGWPMAKLQQFMGQADSRTTPRYYDYLEVEDLEAAFDLVPDLAAAAVSAGRAISGSKLATALGVDSEAEEKLRRN